MESKKGIVLEKVQSEFATAPEMETTITLNIGGTKFLVSSGDIASQITCFYRSEYNEYYFDRCPQAFCAIYEYLKTGILCKPKDMCGKEFKAELDFWNIDEQHISDSCWVDYCNGIKLEEKTEAPASVKLHVWHVLENTHPVWMTKLYAVLSCLLTISMIVTLIYSTIPEFKKYRVLNATNTDNYGMEEENDADSLPPTMWAFAFFTWFFCVEFLIRLIICPDKHLFVKSLINYLDLLVALSCVYRCTYFLIYRTEGADVSFIIMLRVFRILWFMRHIKSAAAIGYVFEYHHEALLCVVLVMHLISVAMGTCMFYAEFDYSESHYRNTREGFYWGMITLTTVGYGDMRPLTGIGKLVAVVCALSGVFCYAFMAIFTITGFNEYISKGQYTIKKKCTGELSMKPSLAIRPRDVSIDNQQELTTIKFMINGRVHEILKSSLDRMSPSWFSQLREQQGVSVDQVYVINDVQEDVFISILTYYRTGCLYFPKNMYARKFKDTLLRFGVDPYLIDDSTWVSYKQSLQSENPSQESGAVYVQPKCTQSLWNILENNDSRYITKGYVLLATIVTAALMSDVFRISEYYNESESGYFEKEKQTKERFKSLIGTSTVNTLLLGGEFLLRFISSPNKRSFFLSSITVIDVLVIVSSLVKCLLIYLNLQTVLSGYLMLPLHLLILLRFCHLMWFFRHQSTPQAIIHSITRGWKDLLFLIMMFAAASVWFALVAYRLDYESQHSQMRDAVNALWWSTITITTVGYGDITPITPAAKLFSQYCALFGVFFYACVASVVFFRVNEYLNDVQHRKPRDKTCCTVVKA